MSVIDPSPTDSGEAFAWVGPLGDRGGYGNVARNYVRGLATAGARVVGHATGRLDPDLGPRDMELLGSLPAELHGDETVVAHADPGMLRDLLTRLRAQWSGRLAACTIAETDRLVGDWADACNLADEVWVPTTFNELTFACSGVDARKLRVVPYGLDVDAWPLDGPRAELAPENHTVFVYTFAFDWRKGFDLLLAAYLNEFTRDDDVTLVLKVYDPSKRDRPLRGVLSASVADSVDLFRQDLPRVVVMDRPVGQEELAAIYRRADLYISTDRANGWGMPCMEAMALGRATATVDWSGSTEFMTADTSLLIPAGELVPVDERLSLDRPAYAGQRWPAVRVEDVQQVLRAAASGDADLAALGARGREAVLDRWTTTHAGAYVIGRDSGAYERRPGLRDWLRPRVGLAAESPLADARESVFVLAHDGPDWLVALDAYVRAFGPEDPVSLCVWGAPGTDEVTLGASVVQFLESLGVEVAHAPDLMVSTAAPEEALADPRVRGVIGAPGPWRAGLPVVPSDPAALAAAIAPDADPAAVASAA